MKFLFLYKYANYEPLGIMTLSAVLKKAGHQCIYIDIKFERNLIKRIKSLSPDIIAYSIITGSHKYYKKLNLKLKKHFDFISLFGGPHCTFFPDFIHETGVDIICRGEAENAISILAKNLQSGSEIRNIPNLWVKQNGQIFKNEIADLCLNLDEIPYADRNLVNDYNHYHKMKRRDVITTRGCPYNCTYCFNHANKLIVKNKGRYVRQRSVDNVINELLILKTHYNTRKFHFQDDVFTVNRKWTFEFCEKYLKHIALPFEIQLRVNLVDEEIVRALKNAGCVLAMYGIESGHDHIRMDILNRNITKEKIVEVASLFRKYSIRTMSVNMVGLPDESIENALETLKLNIKCKPNYAWNSVYHPYPMTKLADYSIAKGYFNGDTSMFKSSFLFSKSVMKTPDIKRIERLHYLFPIAVDLPIFYRLTVFLTKLPLTGIYKSAFFVHRAYAALFSLKRIKLSEILLFEKSLFTTNKRNYQKL